MAAVLQQLQGVFDLVRLVDPERAKVLTLHPDGTLEERAGHCHVCLLYTSIKLWLQEFSSACVTVWVPWRLWLAQWNRVPATEMDSPQ